MGYDDALNLAAQKLAQIPPQIVCQNCGAHYEDGEFFVPWFNAEKPLSAASVSHKIIWLHYLTAGGIQKQSGRLIAYREAAPALFYEANFIKRAVKPLVNHFGKNPQNLISVGTALGGQTAKMGDAAVTINVLPYVPMTFIIWEESEEFPPDGNILFDQTAKTWLVAEDLAVLAGLAVCELIEAGK
ncbi:hypothetical protein R84B8_00394 [Treponema sp. R8-4-B8]